MAGVEQYHPESGLLHQCRGAAKSLDNAVYPILCHFLNDRAVGEHLAAWPVTLVALVL